MRIACRRPRREARDFGEERSDCWGRIRIKGVWVFFFFLSLHIEGYSSIEKQRMMVKERWGQPEELHLYAAGGDGVRAQRRLRWEHASSSALPTAGLQFRSSGQGALG